MVFGSILQFSRIMQKGCKTQFSPMWTWEAIEAEEMWELGPNHIQISLG
jgi:hypothetical protein